MALFETEVRKCLQEYSFGALADSAFEAEVRNCLEEFSFGVRELCLSNGASSPSDVASEAHAMFDVVTLEERQLAVVFSRSGAFRIMGDPKGMVYASLQSLLTDNSEAFRQTFASRLSLRLTEHLAAAAAASAASTTTGTETATGGADAQDGGTSSSSTINGNFVFVDKPASHVEDNNTNDNIATDDDIAAGWVQPNLVAMDGNEVTALNDMLHRKLSEGSLTRGEYSHLQHMGKLYNVISERDRSSSEDGKHSSTPNTTAANNGSGTNDDSSNNNGHASQNNDELPLLTAADVEYLHAALPAHAQASAFSLFRPSHDSSCNNNNNNTTVDNKNSSGSEETALYIPGGYGWRLQYRMTRDGTSMATFYAAARGHQCTMLVIRSAGGCRCGCFATEEWNSARTGFHNSAKTNNNNIAGLHIISNLSSKHVSPASYFGTGESFVFRLDNKRGCKIYFWTGTNNYIQYANRNAIGVGGGNEGFSLFLSEGFLHCTTSSSATFENEPLVTDEEAQGGNFFACNEVELWAIS